MVIYVCNVWSTLHAQKKAFEGLEKFWISQRSAKYAIMTIFADDPCGHTKAREGPNLSTMMVPQVGLFTRKFSERSIVVCHWVSFFTCTWPIPYFLEISTSMYRPVVKSNLNFHRYRKDQLGFHCYHFCYPYTYSCQGMKSLFGYIFV